MGHILVRYRQNCVHIWLILKVDLRFMQMCDWQTHKLTDRCLYRNGVSPKNSHSSGNSNMLGVKKLRDTIRDMNHSISVQYNAVLMIS